MFFFFLFFPYGFLASLTLFFFHLRFHATCARARALPPRFPEDLFFFFFFFISKKNQRKNTAMAVNRWLIGGCQRT